MASSDFNWIIPVSAAIQAVATIVLVIVTAWYVRLTKRIVETGREQLSDARAILEAQTGIGRARLAALAARLLKSLEDLPDGGVPEHQLRHSSMWSQIEEDRLLELTTTLGTSFGQRAPDIIAALVWIRQLYTRIIKVSPSMGYRTDQNEDLSYAENRKRAIDNLRSIVSELHQ